jgi:hypothetical protein
MSLASNITPILIGVLAVALLIALPFLIKILTQSIPSGDILSGDFRLTARAYFFSKPENSFYTALAPIAQELGLCVFPKVGLNDIFLDKPDGDRGQYARYAQMHVDYLLVTCQDYRPVAGIELSGASHERERQRTRDTKKSAVFNAGGLPLIRCSNGAQDREIRQQLDSILGRKNR